MAKLPRISLVEIVAAVIFFGLIGSLFYMQHATLAAIHRDDQRKTAINAINADLTEVIEPKTGGYPRLLDAKAFSAIDASLLRDPGGAMIGTAKSDYRYEAHGCNGGDLCTGYVLSTRLERETDYIKTAN